MQILNKNHISKLKYMEIIYIEIFEPNYLIGQDTYAFTFFIRYQYYQKSNYFRSKLIQNIK